MKKATFLGFCLVFASSMAWGGSLWKDNSLSTCTTDLCSAQKLRGVLLTQRTPLISPQPFVIQLFAKENECLRVEVTTAQAGFDTGMTLVSPAGIGAGLAWTDDDSGGFFNPRIEVNGTPVTGWYTLHIAEFFPLSINGERFFTVAYGRYDFGNSPNCDFPTPALLPNVPGAGQAPLKAGF